MIILDSNVWVALLNKDDSQNLKAEKIIGTINEKIIIPEYVVLETVSVLSIRVSKKAADNFLEFITENKEIVILNSSQELFDNAVDIYRKIVGNKLSFVDVYLLSLSGSYQIITFDRELQKRLN